MNEYKVIACNVSNKEHRRVAEHKLSELGAQGWKIISTNHVPQFQTSLIYTLERPVTK